MLVSRSPLSSLPPRREKQSSTTVGKRWGTMFDSNLYPLRVTYGRARITSFLGNHGQEVGRKIISPKAPGYTGFGMHGGRRRVFDEFRGKNSGRKKSFRRLAVEIGKIP